MKQTLALLVFSSIATFPHVQASTTVAVIDSGVDYKHTLVSMWKNQNEVENNQQDDDGNKYVDDIYGWNFAESNNQVIDYKYLGTFSPTPYRFFEIQKKVLQGTATAAEIEWMQKTTKDTKSLMELQKFGNFVHGTHVAGIVSKESPAEVLAVKLIPTEIKPFILEADQMSNDQSIIDLKDIVLKGIISKLASTQGQIMTGIGSYLANHHPAVANGSFGTGVTQAKALVRPLFQALNKREPDEEELLVYSRFFLEKFLAEAEKMVKLCPDTLFVFAAGNDHNNNDVLPTSPASVNGENVISVAAGMGNVKLANFSNYGKLSVDVMAPGVSITSAIPGNQVLELSGTSQASPYVANIASQVRELNPNLTPAEVKRLIMQTVDKRIELAEKVASSGVVNVDRAVYAAKASIEMSLNKAIALSLSNVENLPESLPLVDESLVYPVAMPSLFR